MNQLLPARWTRNPRAAHDRAETLALMRARKSKDECSSGCCGHPGPAARGERDPAASVQDRDGAYPVVSKMMAKI